MANTLFISQCPEKWKHQGKKTPQPYRNTMSLYRDNWLKDQEDERSLGNFFTRINFLHFATDTSPRCSSLRVHISGIHCYNPNAGLVRQKAGMEALIFFIGSPVTGDPVLDIAWQHQNHEKRRPFKLKKHVKTGSMKGFSWCLHSNTSEIQPIFGKKQMSYISSKLPFTGCTKMVKYDSGWHPAENQLSKTKRVLGCHICHGHLSNRAFQTRDHSFGGFSPEPSELGPSSALSGQVRCVLGALPANPKVLVERAWRSLHNKNRRHWPNAKKTVGLSLRLGFFEEIGTDWYNLSMIYTHSSRPHVHQWSPVVIAWQLDFMGPVGWVPCSNRQPSCVNDDPVARWGMWQGCSMLYWNSTCMTCMIYIVEIGGNHSIMIHCGTQPVYTLSCLLGFHINPMISE